MDDIRLTVAGGKELADALRQLPDDVGGEILATALVEGARPIKDDAAERASIHRVRRRHPEAIPLADTIETVVKTVAADHAKVNIQSNSPTAHLVELGHREVHGGKVVGEVQPYPFMRPAADAHVEDSVRIIAESLGKEIEDAFQKRAPHEAE